MTVGYQPGHGEDKTGGYVGAVLDVWRCRHPGAQLTNLGCFGDKTTAAATGEGSGCSYPEGSQLAAAVAAVNKDGGVGLVTIAIGYSDVSACTHAGIDLACVADHVRTVSTNLTTILTRIRAAAPSAHIVVLTYYNPLLVASTGADAPSTEAPRLANPQVATDSAEMLSELNRALAVAATQVGGRVADVAGAFALTDSSGSPVPVNVQRLCDWTYTCRLDDSHANDAGYAAIARAVIAVL